MEGVGNEGCRVGEVADKDLHEEEEEGETQHREETAFCVAEDAHLGVWFEDDWWQKTMSQ